MVSDTHPTGPSRPGKGGALTAVAQCEGSREHPQLHSREVRPAAEVGQGDPGGLQRGGPGQHPLQVW